MTAATKTKAAKPANTKPAKATSSGLGLDSIGDLSSLLDAPAQGPGPLALPLDAIDEDPNQPRTTFDRATLNELAESIKSRGVKTPISVRPNLEAAGRYLINHGARRYRASKIAGKTTIPGFVDGDYTEADQVIENVQRDNLTAREIADFIGRELAKGKKKKDIAASISKSAAFVTQHVALLDLPDPIALAFNDDRCRDVTVIYELVTAHKQKPLEVAAWLKDENQEVTRGSVRLLREFLSQRQATGANEDEAGGQDEGGADEPTAPTETPATGVKGTALDPDKLKRAIVLVEHLMRPARLLLTRRPSADGFGWIRYEDDGTEVEAELGAVRVNRLIEG